MQPGFQAPSGGVGPPQAAVRPLLPAGVRPQEQAGANHRQSPAGPDSDSQLSQVSWLQVLLPSSCLCLLAGLLDLRDTFPRMCIDVQSLVRCLCLLPHMRLQLWLCVLLEPVSV